MLARTQLISELPQQMQQLIQNLDTEIEKYTQLSSDIEKLLAGIDTEQSINKSVTMMSGELGVLHRKIEMTKKKIQPVEDRLHTEMTSVRQIHIQLQRGTNSLINLPPDIYWNKIDDFSGKKDRISKMIVQIERHNAADSFPQAANALTAKTVTDCLKSQHRSLIGTTEKVASMHNKVEALKQRHSRSSPILL